MIGPGHSMQLAYKSTALASKNAHVVTMPPMPEDRWLEVIVKNAVGAITLTTGSWIRHHT